MKAKYNTFFDIYNEQLFSVNKDISFFKKTLDSLTSKSHTQLNEITLSDYYEGMMQLKKDKLAFYKANDCLSVLVSEYYRNKKNGYFVLVRRYTYNERELYYTIAIVDKDNQIYFIQESFLSHCEFSESMKTFFVAQEVFSTQQDYKLYTKYNSDDIILLDN